MSEMEFTLTHLLEAVGVLLLVAITFVNRQMYRDRASKAENVAEGRQQATVENLSKLLDRGFDDINSRLDRTHQRISDETIIAHERMDRIEGRVNGHIAKTS
tara:strand:+ start:971 stop:1276 length:306 start_codon:yes stop_codon:yes gene_type:complete